MASVDPVSTAKALIKAVSLAEKLARVASNEPKEIAAALTEGYREYVRDVDAQAQYLATRLLEHGERLEEITRRLDASVDEHQSARVLHNFAYEAMREALDSRREMLAAAAAALSLLEFDIEEKARCERTLRQLDVGDVLWLEVLDRACGPIWNGKSYGSEGEIRHEILARSPSKDALLSSGCVAITYTAGAGGGSALAGVTTTGHLVARTMRFWVKGKALPLDSIPGRVAVAGSRSVDDAHRFIDERAPALRNELARLTLRHRAIFDATKCGQTAADEPAADGKAVLRFFEVAPADARIVEPIGASDRELIELMGGVSVDRLAVVVRDTHGVDTKCLEVHGPRDVLAHLADDLDAKWV